MQIHSTLADPELDPYTAWFLYGPTGSGKTRAAATFPRPLILVPRNESSQLSLRQFDLPYTTIGREDGNPQGAAVKVRPQLQRFISDMRQAANEADAYLAAAWKADPNGESDEARELFAKADKAFPYETFVFESLSHLTDLLVEEIGNSGSGKAKGKMDIQKWGEIQSFYRNLHNALRGLPIHIVYTALDAYDDEQERGGPAISGKTSERLPSACDVIGYCEEVPDKTPTYRIHFRRYKNYVARSRFDAVPRVVTNFNFEKLRADGLFKA